MRSLTLTVLLLCSHSCVSGFETETVKVQLGEEVTLTCSNISQQNAQADWFRVVNRTKPSCISAMFGMDGKVTYCDGFQDGKFEMRSNVTTVSLKIKHVDLTDYGLYFCGIYLKKNTIIVNATEIRRQDNPVKVELKTATDAGDITGPVSWVLGALTVLLTVTVVVLAVKVRKLQTCSAVAEDPQPGRSRDVEADLNYAALHLQGKPQRSRKPAPQRQLEPHAVYAATR